LLLQLISDLWAGQTGVMWGGAYQK
jgi:hypothetical protein